MVLEKTGAVTAHVTLLPERANALLTNNKSTLITNCQPNQLAVQHSPVYSPQANFASPDHTALRRECCSSSVLHPASFFFGALMQGVETLQKTK